MAACVLPAPEARHHRGELFLGGDELELRISQLICGIACPHDLDDRHARAFHAGVEVDGFFRFAPCAIEQAEDCGERVLFSVVGLR